ncbi:hypothetical protein XELAEV_18026504mg [Xenopus laevis]|uniref:Uncharacterized protein n=1 Tax=Xenopus laevis TaxID=8355 RepID=A0A974HJE8_XENLA|nr:hypothetical protein XELAEV_18026504mg [Xenopus laevis]
MKNSNALCSTEGNGFKFSCSIQGITVSEACLLPEKVSILEFCTAMSFQSCSLNSDHDYFQGCSCSHFTLPIGMNNLTFNHRTEKCCINGPISNSTVSVGAMSPVLH